MAVSWAVTVEDRWIEGKKRHARVKLVASGTYTTGGDAIPAAGVLGMKRNVDFIHLLSPAAFVGHVYKYDVNTKKILIYVENDAATYAQRPQMAQLAAGTSVTATVYCEVVGT